MEHKYQNQQELFADLETIKAFIYQTLIFNHLKKLFGQNASDDKETQKIHIIVEGGFKIQFEIVADLEVKETLKNVLNPRKNSNDHKHFLSSAFELPDKVTSSLPNPVYKSQLITDLLLFYKRKNLFTFKRASLKQELQIIFKTTLFKILTQDIEYRTVSPAYSGSLGLYYYEKRSIKKVVVNKFLQNFAKE